MGYFKDGRLVNWNSLIIWNFAFLFNIDAGFHTLAALCRLFKHIHIRPLLVGFLSSKPITPTSDINPMMIRVLVEHVCVYIIRTVYIQPWYILICALNCKFLISHHLLFKSPNNTRSSVVYLIYIAQKCLSLWTSLYYKPKPFPTTMLIEFPWQRWWLCDWKWSRYFEDGGIVLEDGRVVLRRW